MSWVAGAPLHVVFIAVLLLPLPGLSQERPAVPSASTNPPPPMMLTVEGTNVWIQRARSNQREHAYPNQILEVRDHGYTGRRSRATVRLSDLSVARVSEESDFVIEPAADPKEDGSFSLLRGLLYLLHRDRPGSHRFRTPTATAATRGTEFTLEVEPGTGRTLLTVLEGEAELRNDAGLVILRSGEQGVAALGQVPFKTAVVDTTNLVQWCLYYPGVLNVSELQFTPAEQTALAPSLAAWREGDLLRAVAEYPADRAAVSSNENVYAAALLLAVGQVNAAERQLDSLTNGVPRLSRPTRPGRLSDALRQVIDAVKLRPDPTRLPAALSESSPTRPLATEWLAASYSWQALRRLDEALAAAKQSVAVAPDFGFGWVRVAELEFSYGRIPEASRALTRGLELAPRHAQGLALRGFLLSAQNRTREAIQSFEQAMAIDGGLGNAWLGRGLCRIRRGEARAGRMDLQVAATLEPQRSLLRSYLGKAFSNSGDPRHARSELELARQIDAGDPTPWLYSALLRQELNEINDAVRDLEHSKDLNDNRQVYRSRLALDQDRAVRGANLAGIYRDAGLAEVSLREAGRAVTADYANDAAHLFLAHSYNQVRDPKRINLRYETATISEYLLGNLLAPVGAGALSQPLSQQEYGRLLERDRVGAASSTEYRSNGDWIQSASQFGTFGNTAYAADLNYRFENGTRPNNELEQLEAGLSIKQQLTPQDIVLVQAGYYHLETGDVNQYYRQSEANPLIEFQERQEPILLAGYHHEWSPGTHTLLLASRLQDVYEVENPLQTTLFFNRFSGPIGSVAPMRYDQNYRSEFLIYGAELQQIWQRQAHTFVLGARVQAGEFETHNQQTGGRLFTGAPVSLNIDQHFTSDFDRQSIYAYDHWQIWETLVLAGGVTFDHLQFPENYRYAPISDAEVERERVSPKAGFIFTPWLETTLRGAYAQGLGGVSLDQSYRLEPSQVAGFNQAYRSLIPESVAGANAAPSFETWSLSLEQRFSTGTYLGVGGEILSSDVNRQVGVVQLVGPTPVPGPVLSPQQTREKLDYREQTLWVTLNQLIGKEWAFGATYRLSKAELEDRFPGIPSSAALLGGFEASQDLESILHQVRLSAYYNHASGFFGGLNGIWTAQSNHGYNPDRPGDNFWQINLEAGWRFFRRRLETSVALLNIADQDYRLNPLNLTTELPRERTLAVRLKFNF